MSPCSSNGRTDDSKPSRWGFESPQGLQKEENMEDNVRKELDGIKGMVERWKEDYMRHITGEHDEYLIEDFLEELNILHVYPFACRLRDMEYITQQELTEFMGECYEYVAELKEAIDKARK